MERRRDFTAEDRPSVFVACSRLLARVRNGRPRLSVPEPFDCIDIDVLVPTYALPYLPEAPSTDEVMAFGALPDAPPEGWPGDRVRRRP